MIACTLAVSLVSSIGSVVEAGPSGGALPPQLVQILPIAGTYGIPADADMVAINVTAVNPAGPGHITAFPCDQDLPDTSNLNYVGDDVTPNFALVRLSSDGEICIATHDVSDVIVDVVGYVPAGSAITALPAPVRTTDTRTTGIIPAGTHTTIDLGNIPPPDATLVMFNLTAVGARNPGHATVYPCTPSIPNTSSINYTPGRTTANFVTARLSDTGTICLYTHATSNYIVDLVAYSTDGITTLPQPIRLRDTRTEGTGPLPADTTTTLDIAGHHNVPTNATAAIYNLTAPNPQHAGHATSYPCNTAPPNTSNLNYRPGRTAANGTITKLSPTGRLCIHTLTPTHLVIDLIGYTTNATHYTPITPVRVWDTRQGWQPTCPWTVGFRWDSIVVYNVETHATLTTAYPTHSFSPVVVDHACTSIAWVHRTADFPAQQTLQRFWFDGHLTHDPLPDHYDFTRSVNGTPTIAQLDDGRWVAFRSPDVVDLFTNEVISSPSTAGDLSIVDPSGLLLTPRTIFDGGIHSRATISTLAGDLLGEFEAPPGVTITDMSASPDGMYVVIAMNDLATSDRIEDATFALVVTTVFGAVVDHSSAAYPYSLSGRFVGRGALRVCVYNKFIFSWNLFGEIGSIETPGRPPGTLC